MKYLLIFVVIALCKAAVIEVPRNDVAIEVIPKEGPSKIDLLDKWGAHLLDFYNLIDMDKMMMLVMVSMSDPDVSDFFAFISSERFKGIALEIIQQAEVKEAIDYLRSKGYDVNEILELINSYKADPDIPRQAQYKGQGLTRFLQAMIQVLPIGEWKKLLQTKIETAPEVAHLVQTVTDEEFLVILKRISENPKVLELKVILEDYGVDFGSLRVVVEGILGDYIMKTPTRDIDYNVIN